ncbi:KR domain-containing protein, partial [Streptomyces sp. NPDC018031]|uniref:KR domain-containing protein n=1 Tax=Streptomyces sp. NPDC018031 TaxID=3365033 RepID=UPI00379585D9
DLGAHVTITACDTTDHHALADLLTTIPEAHPLTAVIHTAGTLDDGILTSLTPDRLDTVLQPKIDAALNLHHLTHHLPLTHFTLFSSASGIFGAPGQANYAAANTFLDALAHHRHTHHQPATSLAWGLWATTSNLTDTLNTTDHQRIQRGGINPLTDHQALTLLDTTHTHPHTPLLIPIHLNPTTLRNHTTNHPLPPLLRKLAPTSRREAPAAPEAGSVRERLAVLPSAKQHEALLALVVTHAAATLGHADGSAVPPDRPFSELGFDSLTAVELRNRLNAATGLRLPATLLFDQPNPESLTGYLRAEMFPDPPDASVVVGEQLDRLEEAALSLSGDGDSLRTVRTRLQGILSKLNTSLPAAPDAAITEQIRSASATEILEFIDKEIRHTAR